MSVLLGSWLAGVLVFAAAFRLPFPVGGFPGSRKGYLFHRTVLYDFLQSVPLHLELRAGVPDEVPAVGRACGPGRLSRSCLNLRLPSGSENKPGALKPRMSKHRRRRFEPRPKI